MALNFKNTYVYNFDGAFRGMRNPLNSWAKSDSYFGLMNDESYEDITVAEKWVETKAPALDYTSKEYADRLDDTDVELLENGILRRNDHSTAFDVAFIGPADMKLAQNLIKAGNSDAKFLRQIFISTDITGPAYWLAELDTYKIATTRNSTSLQHKGMSRDYTIDDFSIDKIQLFPVNDTNSATVDSYKDLQTIIDIVNKYRQLYTQTKDYTYFRIMRQLLPMGYNYTITWSGSYANLRNMYFQRKKHKLTEWSVDFIKWIETLPYAKQLITWEDDYDTCFLKKNKL